MRRRITKTHKIRTSTTYNAAHQDMPIIHGLLISTTYNAFSQDTPIYTGYVPPPHPMQFLFFVDNVKACMRANAHNVQQGEQETRGKDKTMGSRDMRSVEVGGMGQGTWGFQDGHYRNFQEGKQGI